MNDDITSWFEVTLSSLKAFGEGIMSALPNIIGAIFIILIGWMIAKVLSKGIKKVLKAVKLDEKLYSLNKDKIVDDEMISKIKPTKIVEKFIYWIVLLLFFISASDILGWNVVSIEIGKLINFLPKIFIALIIFAIGYFIASIVRNVIKTSLSTIGLEYSKMLSNIVFYIILVILTISAINQIGIDTTLITSNIVIILAAVLATLAISFGFASKDFLANILSTYYAKNNFKVGQTIKIGNTNGTIVKLDKIQVVLKTDTGKTVLSSKELISNKVDIIKE